ncbi:hypothetical protein AWENTII_007935 [Aspergillus wentii]
MSLNGLDNPAVLEAYQTALTEAGGWFLLHYVSRDEVALLERGTGGVPEVRNAIDGYEEKSPLYGFLQYRRRKLVISFMPQGMSRLVQGNDLRSLLGFGPSINAVGTLSLARTTVQFQSVLDKFSPHDTVFSLTQSTELTESALSSACLLHAASEENATGKDESQAQSPPTDTRQRSASQLSHSTVATPRAASRAQTVDEESPAVSSPIESQSDVPAPSMPSDPTSERPSSRRTLQEDPSHPSYEPRKSSQSARPSLRDLEQVTPSPKVKLGPRPSVDNSGRPRTAGGLSRNQDQRPVASLPAGIRSSSLRKPNPNSPRPRSQGSPLASTPRKGAPPVPPLLVPPLSMSISRPQISPGAKSLSAMSSASGMSPEKERLMKALQMRKKQMEKRAEEGKKNQKATEEQQDTSSNADGDKENMDHAEKLKNVDEVGQKEEEKGQATPTRAEPGKEVNPISSDLSKPDPAVDMAISDSDGDQPSNTSLSSTAATDLTDRNESPETDQSQTPPTTAHQRETDVLEKDSAVFVDSEAKSGPGSSSATMEVPLDKSEKAPEEIAPPTPETGNPPAPVGKEADVATKTPESTLPDTQSHASQPDPVADPSTPTALNVPESEHDLTPEAKQPVRVERKDKRKPYLEPLQVPTPEYSDDDNLLSDDSFMEELRSATFEEAKPVEVGKSPLSPVYSTNGNEQTGPDAWRNSRAVSNPSALGRQPPTLQPLATSRSVSSPYGDLERPTTPVLVAKKINVSSGISKRIQALEKLSNTRESSPSNSNQNLAAPTPASYDPLRKRASISLGNGQQDSTSLSRTPSFSSEAISRAPSLARRDSQSSTNATSSVSVTARIVRDPNITPNDPKPDPFDSGVLNLQASPLTVEHKAAESPASQDVAVEAESSPERKRSPSMSSVGSGQKSVTPTIPARSESRLSVSSHSKGEAISPRSPEMASSPEDKKESRASRLLRRMSSITSSSRKSVASALSPAAKEEDTTAPPAQKSDTRLEAPQAVDIGEVNVQFPDTLLWKRRYIRVDDKGYLVLTPGNVDSSNRNLIKRYHLTEFRTPCLPDEDRQELPNSILLDFLDGSTLQCACESRQGQASVLQTLVHAHSTQQQLVSQ